MAQETILIVDPDTASLKLAAAVLRREGYKVPIASGAEQALMTLWTTRVDLMLVSTTMPGLSAAELVARMKQEPRTAHVIPIALLAPSDDPAQATQLAGFAGCLTKPLDPIELPRAVRDFLDSQKPAASETVEEPPPTVTFTGPEAEDLRRAFVAGGVRQTRVLVNSLGSSFDGSRTYPMVAEWAAQAAVLGLSEISRRARAAVQALQAYPFDSGKLYGPVTNLLDAFSQADEERAVFLPAAVVERLGCAQVALFGFAPREAERLCEALARAGAGGRLYEAGQSIESEAVRSCALFLVHIRPETAGIPWLGGPGELPRPLVLAGRIHHLLALDPAIQERAAEFLIDSWPPEEVVLRLGLTLLRIAGRKEMAPEVALRTAEPARPKSNEVLIVDDDASVRLLVQTVLENHGIRCRVAANGAEGIEMSRAYQPAAALLDVNMPDMSGFEALPKIRAAAPGVRVVMLTGREQEVDILQGFALGSDDYVVKPFIPMELLARVKRLL